MRNGATSTSRAQRLPPPLRSLRRRSQPPRSIHEPVSNSLTEWKDDPRGRITIRQFLTMSSGLAGLDQTRDGGPLSPIVQLTDGAEVYKAAFAFPKVAEPGMDFGLNQVDSKILGRIVERATGRPFADYLCEKRRRIGAGTATRKVDAEGQAATLCCMLGAMDWLRVDTVAARAVPLGTASKSCPLPMSPRC